MGIASNLSSVPVRLSYTGKFCLPQALTLTGIFSTVGNSFTINALIVDPTNARKAIATVTAGHNLNPAVKSFLTISGATQTEYNGYVQVTVLTRTTFSYYYAGSVTSPATGTIIADPGGCKCTGTATLAGSEFQQGDWLYIPSQNLLRQVSLITGELAWEFYENLTSNASGVNVQKAPSGLYSYLSVLNGSAAAIYQGVTMAASAVAVSEDINGLAPVCGDATDTTLTITATRRGKV